jgi:hypothetical protein
MEPRPRLLAEPLLCWRSSCVAPAVLDQLEQFAGQAEG